MPHIPPKTPAQALATFKTRPGFRVELVAAEPQLTCPVALDIDEDGRMYVAEFTEYNQYANPSFKGKGRIRLLEDTKGTGVYDKSSVFVDDIDAPVAVCCWDGGIFVGSVPHILYFKDTKGTGKPDIRRTVYTGFARDAAGEAMLNSFQWRFDNRIHLSTNLAGGFIKRADRKEERAVNVKGQGMLFDPRTLDFELTSGGGQHGMTIDDWGRTFVCSNSDPMSVLMYDGRYLARNPYVSAPAAAVRLMPEGGKTKIVRASPVEAWRALRTKLRKEKIVPGSDEGGEPAGFFTGATGVTAYRGDAWPEECRGQLFVGEVSGNLVFRARVKQSGAGVGLVGERIDEGCEFLASTDTWFRPVQFYNAPDGNLYVLDMYRELIEGAAFLPPQVLKHMDVSAGIDKGRIWRIAHESGKPYRKPALSQASTRELVALLEHPNGWHRDTASRLLYQRRDPSALVPARELATKSASPLGRLHAMYAVAGLGGVEAADVAKWLRDPDPRVRVHAARFGELLGGEGLVRLASDPDVRVRYQAAFSLGVAISVEAIAALAKLARDEGSDPWFQLAILSSSRECGLALFENLMKDRVFRTGAAGKKMLPALVAQIAAQKREEEVSVVVQALDALPEDEASLALELVRALASKSPAGLRGLLGKGRAGKQFDTLLAGAAKTARDDKAASATRIDAIRTLGMSAFAEQRDLFRKLLGLTEGPQIHAAVLETLGRFNEPTVAAMLLEAWPGFSPATRARAVETLFSRPAWIGAFLDGVENKQIARSDVDPARLALLQSHPDARIKERAARVFAGSTLARRADIVAAYQKSLELPGDAMRGKNFFKQNCAACHKLEGVGTQLGADITAIRNRGKEAMLLSILDPNREVLPQFVSYLVVLDSGRTLTGMITAETATSLTLHRPDGTSETVLRVQIEELRSTGLSFMPEGMEKQLDVQAMADLLAYLNSIK